MASSPAFEGIFWYHDPHGISARSKKHSPSRHSIPARAAPEAPNPTIYLYLAPSLRFLTLRFLNILADIGLRPYHILRRSIRSIDLIRYNSLQARFTALHLSLRHLHSMLDVSLPATVPFPRHQSDGTGRDLYMACLERCVPLILDSQSLFIKR